MAAGNVDPTVEELWIDSTDTKIKNQIKARKKQEQMIDEIINKNPNSTKLGIKDYRAKSTPFNLMTRKAFHLVVWVLDSQAWAPNGAVAVKYNKKKDSAKNHNQSFTLKRKNDLIEAARKSFDEKQQEQLQTRRNYGANRVSPKSQKKAESFNFEIYHGPFICNDWIHANTISKDPQDISAWQTIEKACSEQETSVGCFYQICVKQYSKTKGHTALGYAMGAKWYWTECLPVWYILNEHLMKQNENKEYVDEALVGDIKYISMYLHL